MLNISLFIHDKSTHNLFKIMSYLKIKTIPSLCVLVGQQRLISSKDQNGPSLQVCYFQACFVQKTRLGPVNNHPQVPARRFIHSESPKPSSAVRIEASGTARNVDSLISSFFAQQEMDLYCIS
jgi:hypothetical protein